MTRVPLGYDIDPARYTDYMIWMAERNLMDSWRKYDDKAYVIEFENEQDAVAFKLKFGV
jgi:hypothetical protein